MERPGQDERVPSEPARMYRRVLASWAMDALALRRSGLDLPTWRRPEPGPGVGAIGPVVDPLLSVGA